MSKFSRVSHLKSEMNVPSVGGVTGPNGTLMPCMMGNSLCVGGGGGEEAAACGHHEK